MGFLWISMNLKRIFSRIFMIFYWDSWANLHGVKNLIFLAEFPVSGSKWVIKHPQYMWNLPTILGFIWINIAS